MLKYLIQKAILWVTASVLVTAVFLSLLGFTLDWGVWPKIIFGITLAAGFVIHLLDKKFESACPNFAGLESQGWLGNFVDTLVIGIGVLVCSMLLLSFLAMSAMSDF